MVGFKDIVAAQKKISPYIDFCPLIYSSYFSRKFKSSIFLKPENLQLTGSFKIRGALNKILTLTDKEKETGIITASSGNHALGTAYGAKLTNTRAVIVMPENARKIKINGVKDLGAEVILAGETPAERYEIVYQLQKENGYTLIHSCDDPEVIAGHGTIGLEILKEMENTDTITVPLGAGALASGIACAVKALHPEIRIIGVETDAIPRFTVSRKNGCPGEVAFKPTIADGLKMTRAYPQLYEMMQKYVDDVVSVPEEFIIQATGEILMNGKLAAEPSAVVGLAAVLSGRLKFKQSSTNIIVISGGNIDAETLCGFLHRYTI